MPQINLAQVSGSRNSTAGDLPTASGISLSRLSKRYGDSVALDGVSLDIAAGSFVTILGPSGSGKTTLLGLIAGFVAADEGKISIDGTDMTNVPTHMRNLGVVFQHYALFPHMSVADNIAFPLQSRKMPRKEIQDRVSAALQLVGLADLGHRRPAELSGGQQQRVALARALVYEPSVLLLDEPLGALDRRLRESMQAELKEIHARVGCTFIYVTHDQEEALSMADMTVVMHAGRIEQCGSPMDLYDRPANTFVANFVGDCNLWEGRVVESPAGVFEIVHASGAVLHRCRETLDNPTAVVAIRPEWITVQPGGHAPEPGVISGRLLQQRFIGCETMIKCDSPLGEVLVRVPRAAGHNPTAGAADELFRGELSLHWEPEHTHVIAPGEPAGPTDSHE